jgi:hypothetical protein
MSPVTRQTHYIGIASSASARRTGRIEKGPAGGVNLERDQGQISARLAAPNIPCTFISVVVIGNFCRYFRTVPGRVLPGYPCRTAIQETTVTVCTPLRHARAVCGVVGIGFGPTEWTGLGDRCRGSKRYPGR